MSARYLCVLHGVLALKAPLDFAYYYAFYTSEIMKITSSQAVERHTAEGAKTENNEDVENWSTLYNTDFRFRKIKLVYVRKSNVLLA